MSNEFIKRKSMLEDIDFHGKRNLYCEKKMLTNEASVETFFVNRMIGDLGYKDENIKTKESIEKLTIAKGSKKCQYKPDYCIIVKKKPQLIIDAKSPEENVFDWIEQCAHYCLLLNRRGERIKYFIITNGFKTIICEWDKDKPILEVDFKEFYIGNTKYEILRKLIGRTSIIDGKIGIDIETNKNLTLIKIKKEEAQKIFLSCHNYIWSTEKRGPLSAFTEFVKLIFLKLYNDRILHEEYGIDAKSNLSIPSTANTFSVKWIEERERDIPNPINDMQFKKLLEYIQDDIDKNKKKRIFNIDENIQLKPTTIKGVVKKLEKYDFFGIDEDLNGRLFETFINSTMRGEALGQYFTPRSIVLLGTLLADLQSNDKHIDKVLDASCGTGGFLIEALTVMRQKIRDNNSYSKEQKITLIDKISNECIYGVDAASEPNLARIARINMYLHGDGGSHIYFADGLIKTIEIDKTDNRELQKEILDMKDKFKPDIFDVVLTNPPFSMWYETDNETQDKVLQEYELLKNDNTNKDKKRLRGSALFIERYCGLLKPGGKLVSIVDETVLTSDQYDSLRNFIRTNFIIKAIISLHGDAFQMAKARVKTALIYLEKKYNKEDEQGASFMYSSAYLGIDDMPITTNISKVQQARELAKKEIKCILEQFQKFKNGEKDIWYVPAERLTNRLDVKTCVPLQGRYISKWKRKGYDVAPISSVCIVVEEIINPNKQPEIEFKILAIQYTGICRIDDIRKGRDINFKKMKVVRKGDLVFSEYNAFQGAIGYVDEKFDGALASSSYTVVRCKNEYDTLYLWSILRTTEIRADLLTSAIGMGRQTIDWEDIKNVELPFVDIAERKLISKTIRDTWEAEKIAKQKFETIMKNLDDKFDVESDASIIRFEASKPPK